MVSSSPSSPAPFARAPPKRTYGRRGARLFKARAITPEAGSDTDVSGDDEPDAVSKGAGNGARSKRARTGKGEEGSSLGSERDGEGSSSREGLVTSSSSKSGGIEASSSTQPDLGGPSSRPSDVGRPSTSTLEPHDMARPSLGRSRTEPTASFGKATSTAPGSPALSSLKNGGSRRGSNPPRRGPRRMLSRAESMNASSQPNMSTTSAPTTPRALRTTQSMPITPGSARSLRTVPDESPGSHLGSPIVASLNPAVLGSPSPAAKAKRTYGGNRSFLTQREADLDAALAEDAQPSYSELRKEYEVDTGDDSTIRNLAEEFNLARAPESINDMRSKGENRLFQDDIGVLLGDINNPNQSIALRRSSALDVLQKMQTNEWMSRLRDHTESVFADLCNARGDDTILGAVCLIFVALLAKSRGPLRKVLEGEAHHVVTILKGHLDMTTGPLDPAFKGKETVSVRRLRSIAAKLFDDSGVVGSRRLASFVLAEAYRESTTTPQFQAAVAQEQLALTVFGQLKEDGALFRSRLELYRNGIDLIPRDGTVDLDAIEESLRAISRIVEVSLADREQLAHDREGTAALLHLVVAMLAVAVDEEDKDESFKRQATRCVVSTLQVLAPLADVASAGSGAKEAFEAAHEDDAIFPAFGRLMVHRHRLADLSKSIPRSSSHDASSSPTRSTDGDAHPNDDNATDLLIFMSPVLNRILPTTRTPSIKVAMTPISSCGKRECIFGCRCLTSTPFATHVVSLYNAYDESDDATDDRRPILSMFLTILLTRLLSMAPAHVRPLIERELPGADWKEQLAGLRERLVHHRSVYAAVREHIAMAHSQEGESIGEMEGDTLLDETLAMLRPLLEEAEV